MIAKLIITQQQHIFDRYTQQSSGLICPMAYRQNRRVSTSHVHLRQATIAAIAASVPSGSLTFTVSRPISLAG